MQDRFLTKRVEVLENTLLGPDGVVEQLGFIRAELKDMRQETRAEFAAVRQELTVGLADVRQELTVGLADVRQELTVGLADVQQRIAQVDTHMRLLHEDAISRIANSRFVDSDSDFATSRREPSVGAPSPKAKTTSTRRRTKR